MTGFLGWTEAEQLAFLIDGFAGMADGLGSFLTLGIYKGTIAGDLFGAQTSSKAYGAGKIAGHLLGTALMVYVSSGGNPFGLGVALFFDIADGIRAAREGDIIGTIGSAVGIFGALKAFNAARKSAKAITQVEKAVAARKLREGAVDGVTEYSDDLDFVPLRTTESGLGEPLPSGGTTIGELLAGNFEAPGSRGVTLNQKSIRNLGDLWTLSQKYDGIEFSLTREISRSGDGASILRLYSGKRGSVTVPNSIYNPRRPGPVIQRIGHTHPSRRPVPSIGDTDNLNNDLLDLLLKDPYARNPRSSIIHGPRPSDITIYYPNILR